MQKINQYLSQTKPNLLKVKGIFMQFRFVCLFLGIFCLSACSTQQQQSPVMEVSQPDKIQKALSIPKKIEVPELPEVVEEVEPPVELSFEEKLGQILLDCIIGITTYDVSTHDVIGNDKFESAKYPEGSSITVVAVWSGMVHPHCYFRDSNDIHKIHRKIFQIVHEQDEGFVSLDLMIFEVRRDSYGYDNLIINPFGYSYQKSEADKVNWKRADQVDFFNKRSGRSYWPKSNVIHKTMEDIVRSRWEAKKDS